MEDITLSTTMCLNPSDKVSIHGLVCKTIKLRGTISLYESISLSTFMDADD